MFEKIKGLFSRKSQPKLERKSHNLTASTSFVDYLNGGGNGDLSMYAAVQMYTDAMPFFNAVDVRATHYSQIPIRIKNKTTNEFEQNHPVLDLLSNPNSDISGLEFAIQYSSFFDITGNCFLLATGRIENPPLELMTVQPQNVTFGTGTKFGVLHIPDWIQVTTPSNGLVMMFFAEEVREGDQTVIRFYNHARNQELWHMRQFNPKRNSGNFWGMSRAKPLFLEIQQYLAGNNNNWSMLKRGTRMSLAWVNNRGEELTELQWSRLEEQADKYRGDKNAGATPILDGMDVKDIQSKNTDMQFQQLQEAMVARISMTYKIPLAMVTDGAMTRNNLEVSGLMIYDNSTLPHANYLHDELTRFLLPRYKNAENLVLSFSEFDIPALRPRLLENATKQKALNVNTVDEIRNSIGDEPIGEAGGGEIVYMNSSLIPVGTDFDEPEEDPKILDDVE